MHSIAKRIRIKKVPHGEAPEWVRRAWVGCEMECEHECGHLPASCVGVLAQQPQKGPLTVRGFLSLPQEVQIEGYSVPTAAALKVLEKKSKKAAKWFYDCGYPRAGRAFRFKTDECEVIEYLPEDAVGKIVVYDDMETGTMRPTLVIGR